MASVSSKGKITAKKKSGSAKISAYLASGKVLTVTVIVQKKAVKTTALRDVPKRLTLRRGRTVKLQPTRLRLRAEKITYKSANTRIANVSKKGVITGKKAGTVKITVRSGRKSSGDCKGEVKADFSFLPALRIKDETLEKVCILCHLCMLCGTSGRMWQ